MKKRKISVFNILMNVCSFLLQLAICVLIVNIVISNVPPVIGKTVAAMYNVNDKTSIIGMLLVVLPTTLMLDGIVFLVTYRLCVFICGKIRMFNEKKKMEVKNNAKVHDDKH